MKILFIAMSDSIHTARWINQIASQGWEIHLFPSKDYGSSHPDLRGITVHHSLYGRHGSSNNIAVRGIPLLSEALAFGGREILRKLTPGYRVSQLVRVIRKIRPHIIHSLEFQSAGYLTMESKKLVRKNFPTWIATNWGSDIYLYGRVSSHVPKIRDVLSSCDYYSCECERDILMAREFGFKGATLPVFPNAGGFDLQLVAGLRSPGLSSERRGIMLKGYQHFSGRALVGLRALTRCADMLHGYTVYLYSAYSEDVIIAAELFKKETGIPLWIIPKESPHSEILKHHGLARISIGLSIGDAISTSLLEALVMGSFPIQSWTSCADEWVEDGRNGLLVPPEDPDIVELAIRRALKDDDLVNKAAEKNLRLAEEKLDMVKLKQKTIDIYNYVFNRGSREDESATSSS